MQALPPRHCRESNSVTRSLTLERFGWQGGAGRKTPPRIDRKTLGVSQQHDSERPWRCQRESEDRAGQHRPTRVSSRSLGRLDDMKVTRQKHCFSTLNYNLAYRYNDARVINLMRENVKRGCRGGVRSSEDRNARIRLLQLCTPLAIRGRVAFAVQNPT